MTRELLTVLFSDDVFQYGLGFGCMFGLILGYACAICEYSVTKLLKFIKHKEKKDK